MTLIPVTSMPSQGGVPASVPPGARQAAGAGNRFADALARRLNGGGNAPEDEDILVLLEPDAQAANAFLSPAAHAAGAGVNTAESEDAESREDAAWSADAALVHAHARGVPFDAGRAQGFAPRLRDVQADGRKPGALQGDAPPDDAGDALEPSGKFVDFLDVTDAPDTVAGVLQHIQTANRLAGQGRAHAGATADVPSSAAALLTTPAVGASTTAAVHTDADTTLLAHAANLAAHSAANQDNAGLNGNPLAQAVSACAASAISPASAAGASAIGVPLEHPQWAQALSQHVLHLSRASTHAPQVAQLNLNPAELGPLRIAIELHHHVAHAAFVSAHASVRLAVENALPQLQEQLAQAGISLGQASVSDQPSPQQDTQSQPQAQTPARDALRLAVETDPQPAASGRPPAARNPHALIDTFA